MVQNSTRLLKIDIPIVSKQDVDKRDSEKSDKAVGELVFVGKRRKSRFEISIILWEVEERSATHSAFESPPLGA